MSGSQQVCRSRVRSARKPKDFSRIAEPTSSPRRSRPSVQIRAYSARCTSVSGQMRSISTFGRQLLRDLLLRPAQDEGRELGPQPGERALAVRVQGGLERGARAEEAREQEPEDAPEVELAVLERRARQDHPVPRADREAGLRHLRVGVLDELALVEDGVAELDAVQERAVLAELGVAAEPDERVPVRRVKSLPVLRTSTCQAPGRTWRSPRARPARRSPGRRSGSGGRRSAAPRGARGPGASCPGPSRRRGARGSRPRRGGASTRRRGAGRAAGSRAAPGGESAAAQDPLAPGLHLRARA